METKFHLGTELAWTATLWVVVIPHLPFMTTYRSQYSWSLKMGPIRCPISSVRNYHYTLRNNPEERSSHPLRGGSLKSRKRLFPCPDEFWRWTQSW